MSQWVVIMPRKPRVSLAGVAEHVIQRGNNRQAIFACEDDMRAYVTWLRNKRGQSRFNCNGDGN